MKFIPADHLKRGMRLARPIYNRKGVLLFERDSRLSAQTIESVRNFGLLGVYILDPAEPVPPMSEEDIEFERFQTMSIFSIRDEMERILVTGKQTRLQSIAAMVIKKYGSLSQKVNFYQSLRSREDFVYKHGLNVAILSAMMTHVLKVRLEEQMQTVLAAVIHDIGKKSLSKELIDSDDMDEAGFQKLKHAQTEAYGIFDTCFQDDGTIRRICNQAAGMVDTEKQMTGARILRVANRYDELTSMKLGGNSDSEVKAVQELRQNPGLYDPQAVNALLNSIYILYPGVSVELNTGEKALVLTENTDDILRPVVLSFQDNRIIDLTLKKNKNIQVMDIMKTLDNRYIMDIETLKKAGYHVKEE